MLKTAVTFDAINSLVLDEYPLPRLPAPLRHPGQLGLRR